ncbi:hypothetical protein [Nocardioides sp. LS1]|uniref:hypothetical protein n=1 Tax=Nocardioides sp. LS1 TaxID=1027620 RepID=UPI000F617628|nr:hypothetical protein [Nocardioides sp. LS1]
MTVVEWLQELGGVATRGTLLRLVTRSELDRVVAAGDVLRLARGRYALPDADAGVRAAAALGGVLSVTSAALHHGWAVRSVPRREDVMHDPNFVGEVLVAAVALAQQHTEVARRRRSAA